MASDEEARSRFTQGQAERQLLGCMMLDGSVIPRVAGIVTGSHFSEAKNKLLFDAIVGVWEDKREIDLVILRDCLEFMGRLDEAGGVEYLVLIVEGARLPANAEELAAAIRRGHES